MVDIQSPAAKIRRGKKDRKIVTTREKYNAPLFHRAAIINIPPYYRMVGQKGDISILMADN